MNKLKNIIIRKCKKYIDERGEIYILDNLVTQRYSSLFNISKKKIIFINIF